MLFIFTLGLCLARILIEFYFDKDNPTNSLQALAKKYKDVPPLSLKDVEEYKKQYP